MHASSCCRFVLQTPLTQALDDHHAWGATYAGNICGMCARLDRGFKPKVEKWDNQASMPICGECLERVQNMWANVIVQEGGADKIYQHVVLGSGGSQQPQGVAKVAIQWELPLIFGLAGEVRRDAHTCDAYTPSMLGLCLKGVLLEALGLARALLLAVVSERPPGGSKHGGCCT